MISGESRIALDKSRDCCRSRARHICHVVARGAINFSGITRESRGRECGGYGRARQRDMLIYSRGITLMGRE